jgi:hypothetical protein
MNEDLEGGSVRRGCTRAVARPTAAQVAYLRRGLAEPGGKLPLFDRDGQRYSRRTIQSCIDQGWAKAWFHNPIKPDWLICRLTEAGEAALAVNSPSPAVQPARRARQGTRCDARRLQRLVRELVEA